MQTGNLRCYEVFLFFYGFDFGLVVGLLVVSGSGGHSIQPDLPFMY